MKNPPHSEQKSFFQSRKALFFNGLLPLGLLLTVLLIDRLVPYVTIMPLGAVISAALLALYLRPGPLAAWIVLLTAASLYTLLDERIQQQPPSATAAADAIIFTRIATVAAGGIIAIILSSFRVRLEDRFHEILNILRQLPAAVVVSDESGSIVFLNNDAAELIEMTTAEAVGTSYFYLFISAGEKGRFIQRYLRLIDDRACRPEEIELKLRNNADVQIRGIMARLQIDQPRSSKLMLTVIRESVPLPLSPPDSAIQSPGPSR